jgi:hypothetical protein
MAIDHGLGYRTNWIGASLAASVPGCGDYLRWSAVTGGKPQFRPPWNQRKGSGGAANVIVPDA